MPRLPSHALRLPVSLTMPLSRSLRYPVSLSLPPLSLGVSLAISLVVEPGIAVFRNVAINHIGDLQTQTGTLVYLKGCFDWVTRWQEMMWRGLDTHELPVYDTVVSIANRHTMGAFFHFLLDGVARLPMTERLLKEQPAAKIHFVRPVSGAEAFMGKRDRKQINFRQQQGFFENFQVPLMELLGFDRTRLVTGNLIARIAYVPEPPACFYHSPVLVTYCRFVSDLIPPTQQTHLSREPYQRLPPQSVGSRGTGEEGCCLGAVGV